MNQQWRLACLVGLLLLGFGLRVYQLDTQSMWTDEGLSVYRARQPLPDLLAGTIILDGQASQDTNPPLYFLLLRGLRALAGESIFSLRYLGVLVAVLNLPLLYQIGRRIGGRPVGLGALFWLMLSPLHVWQSQEMRNYTLLLFWNLLSVYALCQIVLPKSTARKGSVVRWGLLWATAVLAGVYTHYFGLFVLAFGVLVLFVWGVQRWQGWPPPRWVIWTVVATGLVALPMLWVALGRFRSVPQVDFVFIPPHHFLNHVFSAFSVGIQQEVVHPWWRVVPVVLLVVWGLVRLWRTGKRATALLILGYWFVPLFLLETLSYFNPLYNGARHLIMSLPPFVLLLGTAVAPTFNFRSRPQIFWLRPERVIVTLLTLSVVVSQAEWLHEQFTAEALVKDDIKGLAHFLSEVAQPEDVIVLHDTIIGFVFDYYYDGSAPWTAVPPWDQRDPEEGVQTFQAAAQGKQRVWFVIEPKPRIAFPRDVLPQWAEEHWVPVWRQRFSALWLSTAVQGYVVDPLVTALPPAAESLSVNWSNQLQLKGVEWPEAARAGAFWQPRFYWSRTPGELPDVTLSVRLVDPQGQIWHQADQPLWANFTPDMWPADAMIRVQPIIPLPAGLPPGDYEVVLRLVDGTTLQPIATVEQQVDLAGLARLTVQPAMAPDDLAQLPEHVPQPVRMNREIELLGYNVPDDLYRPGHVVPIDLYWRVWQQPEADYRLLAEMVDENGTIITQSITAAPTRTDYPTSAWQPDELIQSQVMVQLVAETAQTVRVTLVAPDGRPIHPPVQLGNIEVVPWAFNSTVPPIETRVGAEFGDAPFAILEGYSLPATTAEAGETISLTLVWRTVTPLPQNLVVFVHLADTNETLVGQGDGIPVAGSRPTLSWRSNEILVDSHTFQIHPETAAGSYKLWVGMYDPVANERLPVYVDGMVQPDGRLLLTELEIRSAGQN